MSVARKIVIGLLALGAWIAPANAASAAPGPAWQLSLIPLPTHLAPGTVGGTAKAPIYLLVATNIGAGDANGPVNLNVTFPDGVMPIFASNAPTPRTNDNSIPNPTCKKDTGQLVSCSAVGPVHPSRWIGIQIPVAVSGSLVPGEEPPAVTASVESPGATSVAASAPTTIDTEPPQFGFLQGSAGLSTILTREDGTASMAAGSHPNQLTFDLGFPVEQPGNKGLTANAGHVRDLVTDFPQGVVVNPNATTRCTELEFLSGTASDPGCPADSQIGIVTVISEISGPQPAASALYNMVPQPGSPATVAFDVANVGIFAHLSGGVRSDSDYGLYAESNDTLARGASPIEHVQAQLWGDPTSSSHAQIRDACRGLPNEFAPCEVSPGDTPLITMPSACSDRLITRARARSWEESEAGIETLDHHASADATTVTGIPTGVSQCSVLDFDPTLIVKPDTQTAETPTAFEVKLQVPQNEGVAKEGELEPLDEVQKITISEMEPADTFTLGFKGKSTDELAAKATAAKVLEKLTALSTVGVGNATVSGGPAGTVPFTVTFAGALGHIDVSQIGGIYKSATGKGEVVVTTLRQGRPAGKHGLLSEPELATSTVKDVVVDFPEGVALNPAAADGLDACSSDQIGMLTDVGESPPHFSRARPECPDASKIGEVTVETPLLDHPIPGAVYVAAPYDNPFDTLLAAYVVIDSRQDGIVAKLAGKTEADPDTGRLTVTFEENPQLPVASFEVNLFGGPRAALRTPSTCGTFTTTSVQTPWSGAPPVNTTDSFKVTRGPNGKPCVSDEAEMPHSPDFSAGTANSIAANYSPFLGRLTREDGEQQLKSFTATLPAGLTGKLAGVGSCSDAAIAAAETKTGQEELASPSCPTSSLIGKVEVGAGAGPTPYYTEGKIYMAGPFKGAPLSAVAITPAVAGPFDLGTVAVRVPAYVDPVTAVLSVKDGEEFPYILEGVPLELRDARLALDRNQFTLNPTSCSEKSITGEAISLLGATAPLFQRFQVGGCRGLDYAPKLHIRLYGKTKRGAHPRLRAILEAKPGEEANTKRASVALPKSEFLENAHIQTVCTRVQFAADQCPAGSIYGNAIAYTPLLDEPLEGPVYLRSSDNELPDMVAALKGPPSRPIEVELKGRIDSVNGGIRSTFDLVPDQPVTKFILNMKGGKKGLIVNSRNICKHVYKATAKFDGQNGKAHDFKTKLKADCKGKKGKGKGKGRRK